MTTLTESISQLRGSLGRGFNWQIFLEDNLTGSWLQTIWVLFMALLTAFVASGQYAKLPVSTIIVLVVWFVGILLVAVGALSHRHTPVSRWLKNNLLSSVSNSILTLLVVLAILAAINGVWQWGVVNATFDSVNTAPEFQPDNGATWGVIWAARKLLMTGQLAPAVTWRLWLSIGLIAVLWALSYVTGRPSLKVRLRPLRVVSNFLWVLYPLLLYIFLAGVASADYNVNAVLIGTVLLTATYLVLWWQKVTNFSYPTLIATVVAWPVLYTIWWGIGQSEVFSPINVDTWGGLMLTLIIAASVIILSLPLGMVLALGRQSQVYGIPAWIIWPVAILATLYYAFTSSPEMWATARNPGEQLLALWPLLILGVAYLSRRMFRGNIVSAATTTFIELIRSVPLITLLFMGIVMAPFFLAPGAITPPKPWPVIVAYTLFSSAYMAETIRGGLQAIPKGQYEAADSLGFNTLQKMRFIILPQALRIVIPPIVGQFIGAFKSSSLVSVVGLFDFMGITRSILANPQWLGLRLELYTFLAVVYFLGSSVMSAYSRRLETRLGVGER